MWCYTKDVGMSIYPLKVSEGDDIKNNGKVLIHTYIYIYIYIYIYKHISHYMACLIRVA
jgi:hypothetical protein